MGCAGCKHHIGGGAVWSHCALTGKDIPLDMLKEACVNREEANDLSS